MKLLSLTVIKDFITTIESMLDKERNHYKFLKSHQESVDVSDMLAESNRIINHLTYQLSNYKHYAFIHYGNDALKE